MSSAVLNNAASCPACRTEMFLTAAYSSHLNAHECGCKSPYKGALRVNRPMVDRLRVIDEGAFDKVHPPSFLNIRFRRNHHRIILAV